MRWVIEKISDRPLKPIAIVVKEIVKRFTTPEEVVHSFLEHLYRDVIFKSNPDLDIRINPLQMSDSERNELAWNIFLEQRLEDGIRIGNFTKRQAGNEAQKIGITTTEALLFAKEVVAEIVKKTFM